MASGIDSSSRSPSSLYPASPSAGPSTARSTPSRALFPGFLSSTDDTDFDLDYAKYGSPSSSPSPSRTGSPSGQPYKQNANSPIAGPSVSPSRAKGNSPKIASPTVPSPHKATGRPGHLSLSTDGGSRSPGIKRRPSPLLLGKAKETMGLDEEIQLQRGSDPPLSAVSAISDDRSSLSSDLQDLSLLRHTVRQNLIARPVDSPLAGSESSMDSSDYHTPNMTRSLSVHDQDSISVAGLLKQLQSPSQSLIIDTRPLGSFLESHFPRSANLSIPSLIFKRFKKPNGAQSTSWDSLGGFVSTEAGRGVWDSLEADRSVDVVVIGPAAGDELAKVIHGIARGLVENKGSAKILEGGWRSVMRSGEAMDELVCGEHSAKGQPTLSTSLPLPRSAPAMDAAAPSIPPTSSHQVSHRPSMPSLRPDGAKRNLPSLSINVGGQGGSSKRPPKISLNLDKPLRSATLGSFPSDLAPPTPGLGGTHMLSVDQDAAPLRSPGFSLKIPKSARLGSFQTLCHAQSKLPPSPSSFGDVRRVMGHDEDMVASASRTPNSPWPSNFTPRPGMSRSSSQNLDFETPLSANGAMTTTARNGLAPFIVSTILPSFLYLGPEISSKEDVDALKALGVKRILNVALECDDDAGLGLKEDFKYLRVPMRDIVEESGVAEGMRESCDFLDDARLHSAPTYVHCKAGKSRSVTVVLAYLIHANAWTLKTSYAYVAERRRGISPNIGFVAELMQFEESELGLKQSGGVLGDGGGASGRKGGKDAEDNSAPGKSNPRYMRESLPPTWSHSVDSHLRPPKVSPIGERPDGDKQDKETDKERRPVGDEREVRKNGQWVHQRKAPVDRTTLQPGRRVSKAGLESLRPLNMTMSPRPSPTPSPSVGEGAATPGSDGPLRWI